MKSFQKGQHTGPGPSSRVPAEHRRSVSHSLLPRIDTPSILSSPDHSDSSPPSEGSRIESKLEQGSLDDLSFQLKQAELIEQLQRENQQLKKELKKSKERANYLGHELRGVLENISAGVSDLEDSTLRAEVSLTSPQQLRQEVERMRSASLSMAVSLVDGQELATEHLDIAALEAGKKQVKVMALRTFLKEIIQSFSSKVRIKNKVAPFELKLDMPGEELWIKSDKSALTRIFKNLISNAMKFTLQGSVQLIVRSKPCQEEGQLALDITVRDTGAGMDELSRAKLFQAFSQVHDTEVLDVGGTGLGLTYVKEALDYLEAKVEVKSQLNEGTSFCLDFKFPKATELEKLSYLQQKPKGLKEPALSSPISLFITPLSPLPERQSIKTVGKELSILVVEDNAVNAKLYQRLLLKLGHHCVIAENGLQAVQAFQSAKPKFDIIFMDLNMPVKNGLEACQEIRLWEAAANNDLVGKAPLAVCPIILLSGNNFKDQNEAAQAAGITDYITKGCQNTASVFNEMIQRWVKREDELQSLSQPALNELVSKELKPASPSILPVGASAMGLFSETKPVSKTHSQALGKISSNSRKVHPEPSFKPLENKAETEKASDNSAAPLFPAVASEQENQRSGCLPSQFCTIM